MSIEMSIMSLNQDCFGQLGTIKIAFAPDCFSFCTTRGKMSNGRIDPKRFRPVLTPGIVLELWKSFILFFCKSINLRRKIVVSFEKIHHNVPPFVDYTIAN